MKMEFNEKRMTIEELDDCIAELMRVRDEKRKEQANTIATEVRDHVVNIFNFTNPIEEQYEVYLHLTKKSGREIEVPLTKNALKDFYVLVKRKE